MEVSIFIATFVSETKNKFIMEQAKNFGSLEKIIAIRSKINSFGGTTVSLKNNRMIVAFNKKTFSEDYTLYDITADHMLVGKSGENFIHIPLIWLSKMYLDQLLTTYLAACKEQLSSWAFDEILEEIGD